MALVITLNRLNDQDHTILSELVAFALGDASLQVDAIALVAIMMAQRATDLSGGGGVVAFLQKSGARLLASEPRAQEAIDLITAFSTAVQQKQEAGIDMETAVCVISERAQPETGFEVLIK